MRMGEFPQRSISISELKRFLDCRLRWKWESAPPRGLGLRPKDGVASEALLFGSVIHAALQGGYDRPESTFTKEYLNLVPEEVEQKQLGSDLMQTYDDYRKLLDKDSRIIATETSFRDVEVPGTLATLSGIFDVIVQRPDGLWVMDFKTTSRSYTDWTTQDLQATAYVYAARQMFGEDVKGIIFRFLLKKKQLGTSDLLLKSGKLTKRSNLERLTTSRKYKTAIATVVLKWLVENEGYELSQAPLTLDDYEALLPFVKNEPKFAEVYKNGKKLYYTQLANLSGAWRNWIWDVEEVRTSLQIKNYLSTVFAPTMSTMIDLDVAVGPTGLSAAWALCGKCPFREACKLAMDGADYDSYLKDNFIKRGER